MVSRIKEINQAIRDLDREITQSKQKIRDLKKERSFLQVSEKMFTKLDQKRQKVEQLNSPGALDVDTLSVVSEGWDCVRQLRKLPDAAAAQTPCEPVMVGGVYIKTLGSMLDRVSEKVRWEVLHLTTVLDAEINRVTTAT